MLTSWRARDGPVLMLMMTVSTIHYTSLSIDSNTTPLHIGYSIAEVGKIVLFQVFAKQCASDPNNKIDVVSVSHFTSRNFVISLVV